MEAGITYFFTIQMRDIYNSKQIMKQPDTTIEILASYLDHDDWPSPISIPDLNDWQSIYGSNIQGIALDQGDGTYEAQLTIYKAGSFTLNVRVNSLDLEDSPFTPIEVSPTNLYAPSCITLGIPDTMIAGTEYSLKIQGRDFYSNNLVDVLAAAVGTDHIALYTYRKMESDTEMPVVSVEGVFTDDTDDGVYIVTVTLTKAGEYDLAIRLLGLDVPFDVETVTVEPKPLSVPQTSNFTGVNEFYYTGDLIEITVDARDEFTNFRYDSAADDFELTLTGQTSGTVYGPFSFTDNTDGTYSVSFMFEIVEAYTVSVTLGGTDVVGSPIPNVDVFHGHVQAYYSDLVSSETPITAGLTYVWQI